LQFFIYYKEYECQQDASFEPLMALIGPTGRPVAMRMGPKTRKLCYRKDDRAMRPIYRLFYH